jgi:hypothetical protein
MQTYEEFVEAAKKLHTCKELYGDLHGKKIIACMHCMHVCIYASYDSYGDLHVKTTNIHEYTRTYEQVYVCIYT